ncbi:hypothetical protein TSUD_328170 [Trifolium subterraneum]|uniref:Uncharacterized protein n=1 Tax=Trifolium subterraneum TaxID=3900 RepID=A0A2Z6ML11_TRISU|nr:hypothetical protein TSUD_328170 [Trifolium subterraneum]
MEVHTEQGSGYGSVLVKTSLNNLMYNHLCSWTARAIESNPKITECKGKSRQEYEDQ